jgi:hypothetical protein
MRSLISSAKSFGAVTIIVVQDFNRSLAFGRLPFLGPAAPSFRPLLRPTISLSRGYSGGDGVEWDPEILARLRSSREEVILRRKEIVRRKERNTSLRATSHSTVAGIKMVVGDWYTDELGNRARMIYNAKTVDFEAVYGLSREVSAA